MKALIAGGSGFVGSHQAFHDRAQKYRKLLDDSPT